MRVTTITCDRCNTEHKDSDIHPIKLFVGIDYGTYRFPFKAAEWCRPCIVSVLGTWVPRENEPPNPITAPTIEDMIREIVREEMP